MRIDQSAVDRSGADVHHLKAQGECGTGGHSTTRVLGESVGDGTGSQDGKTPVVELDDLGKQLGTQTVAIAADAIDA
jgi:hypothetical protein